MSIEANSSKQIAEEMQELYNQAERLNEERWEQLFSQSQNLLSEWAIEALNEDEANLTLKKLTVAPVPER